MITYDDLLAAVATIEPTFAGLYFDRGALHVVLTDVNRDPELVQRAMTAVFADHRLATAPIHVEAGEYSFGQLAAWGRVLPMVFSVKGVVSTDIDEVRNRLAVGIVSADVQAGAEAVLTGAGIPREALLFDIRPPVQLLSDSLSGEVRSITGGVHLDLPAVGNWCTLGLNVSYSSQASFVTNTHCSNSWGSSGDGTPFWQAFRSVSADSLGAEGTESSLFTSAHDPRCPAFSACKYSDVDIAPYQSAMTSSQSMGYLARTTTRTRFDSNLVINSTTPAIPIVAKNIFPFAGDTVDKVGARTGWTYGPVTSTCATYPAGNGIITYYMVCQSTVNLGASHGDSGSAIFYFDPSSGAATLAGQLWGGDTPNIHGVLTNVYFSPFNNIQSEFGTIPATIYGT